MDKTLRVVALLLAVLGIALMEWAPAYYFAQALTYSIF